MRPIDSRGGRLTAARLDETTNVVSGVSSTTDENVDPVALHPPAPAATFVDAAATVQQALHWQDAGLSTEGKTEKYDRLSSSVFSFFRGTGRLYFSRCSGRDRHLPRPLLNGDPHPENFGVMQGHDGKLVFGLNDFDEAKPGPFTWDLNRAMTGLALAAAENGLSKKDTQKALQSFAKRYVRTLKDVDGDHGEATARMTPKNAPRVVEKLLKATKKDRSRKAFLKRYTAGKEFIETDEIKRAPQLKTDVQTALNTYAAGRSEGPSFFNVIDVATKSGSGTASLGKTRMWALIEGPSASTGKKNDRVIIELKPSGPSVLDGLTPLSPLDAQLMQHGAGRVAQAQAVLLAQSNPYYGQTVVDGTPHLVRERSPFKASVDVSTFDGDDLKSYGKAMAECLARAHARSDADGGLQGDHMERQVLDVIEQRGGKPAFVDTLVQQALADTQQVQNDWANFKQQYAAGTL